MMDAFNEFCNAAKVAEQSSKIETVIHFIWFHQFKTKQHDITVKEINQYFVDAHLSLYNTTYLKRDLTNSSKITRGSKKDTYKLARKTLDELNPQFLPIFEKEISITERANISLTPYLSHQDIEDSRKMSELYIILHCLENSVRNFIEDILKRKFGEKWWDSVKNVEFEKKNFRTKSKRS